MVGRPLLAGSGGALPITRDGQSREPLFFCAAYRPSRVAAAAEGSIELLDQFRADADLHLELHYGGPPHSDGLFVIAIP